MGVFLVNDAAFTDAHLKGLVTYRVPSAGMFLWCKLCATPPAVEGLIEAMRSHGVCVLPGAFASVDKASPSSHVRLSFVIDEEHYEAASFRLADMLGGLAASGGRPASGELALPEAKRQKSGGDE